MSLSGLIPTSDRRSIITGVLRLVDIIVVIGAGLFALWLAELDLEAANKYLIAVLLGGLLAANFLATAGLYVFERLGSLVNQVGRIGVGWGSWGGARFPETAHCATDRKDGGRAWTERMGWNRV